MKDNPPRLKKWLFSYLIISSLLFIFGFFWSYTNSSLWGMTIKPLIVYLVSFLITFFFYLKTTKKPIGWILITILLAYFFTAILVLFLSPSLTISNSSSANYILFGFSWVFFNTLFMFAGVFSEKKEKIDHWDDDILDDLNV